MRPRVCVLRTDGTNCDGETAYAFEKAGGEPRLVHVNELRCGEESLRQYQVLALPGGFSYGDNVASGKILAVELVSQLASEIQQFIDREGLVIGICNGFQTLVRAGLLPFRHLGDMQVTLTANDSGRFECRWISMVADQPSQCVFTHGINEPIELPVAHGEGKFFAHAMDLELMEADGLVALRYAVEGKVTMQYPANPNGSLNSIAGVCDRTGRIFGLMPHPERFVETTQHPNWRRRKVTRPHGLAIFENAIKYLR